MFCDMIFTLNGFASTNEQTLERVLASTGNSPPPRFKALVEKYRPDVIGTQETTSVWLKYYDRYFKDTYGIVSCSRDGADTSEGEAMTILYRLDRFELLDSKTFWLTRTPDQVSMVGCSACRRICTWVLLRDKASGKEFVVANTHLDYINDTVKIAQWGYLLDGLSELVEKYPVYLTGDFNSEPTSPVYAEAIKTFKDSNTTCLENRSDINFTAGHNYVGNTSGGIIDYCFYTEKSIATWYRILDDQFGGYVSDHYGLIAEFYFK